MGKLKIFSVLYFNVLKKIKSISILISSIFLLTLTSVNSFGASSNTPNRCHFTGAILPDPLPTKKAGNQPVEFTEAKDTVISLNETLTRLQTDNNYSDFQQTFPTVAGFRLLPDQKEGLNTAFHFSSTGENIPSGIVFDIETEFATQKFLRLYSLSDSSTIAGQNYLDSILALFYYNQSFRYLGKLAETNKNLGIDVLEFYLLGTDNDKIFIYEIQMIPAITSQIRTTLNAGYEAPDVTHNPDWSTLTITRYLISDSNIANYWQPNNNIRPNFNEKALEQIMHLIKLGQTGFYNVVQPEGGETVEYPLTRDGILKFIFDQTDWISHN